MYFEKKEKKSDKSVSVVTAVDSQSEQVLRGRSLVSHLLGGAAIESASCSFSTPSWDLLLGYGGGGGDRVEVVVVVGGEGGVMVVYRGLEAAGE